MARGRWRESAAVLLLATALAVAAFEGGVRLLIQPSPLAWGTLLGRPLPPLRVVPPSPPPPADTLPVRPGDPLTWADLQGPMRADAALGYAPRERAVSPNGWWRTNDLGARADGDTTPHPAPGRRRVLVFGESFASGSRVRQEDAWPAVLGAADPALEVVNLAVDGYGMGQSLLRFRAVAPSLEYDTALLVMVPSVDLWREVNTIRSLAKRDWDTYIVMPRFALDAGRLTLVASPYATVDAVYRDNADGLSDRLRAHLRAHDRFYFPTLHEAPSLLGRLVLTKIAVTVATTLARGRLLAAMGEQWIDPAGEAVRVAQATVAAMHAEARARGRRFALVILPDAGALGRLRGDDAYAADWRRLVGVLCPAAIPCLDLTDAVLRLPAAQIDAGYDGSHYGPITNRAIATAVRAALAALPSATP